MDLDFWWLLVIPITFGLGWVAARFDLKNLLSESANLPRSYFRGLNFLLNEQPDKAIDAFIEVVKLDPETTELNFALGNLFRRRGETERAIRVHQNLVNRSDLPIAERDHALYELGQDFMKAGLLGRAEQTFKSIDSGSYVSDAQRSLLTIYQIEKDWRQAIIIAKQLESLGVASFKKEIAQFHCELVYEALQEEKLEIARAELEGALAVNPDSVRATILLGDIAIRAGQPADAIGHWKHIEQQNPVYLPFVGKRLMQAHRALGREAEGIQLLIDYLGCYPLHDLLDIAYPYVAKLRGIDAAYALARAQMRQSPNLTGMARLIEGQLATAEEPRRGELELMHTVIERQIYNLPHYTCQNCGFRARRFYWQCPGCNGWENYVPRHVEPVGNPS